MASDDDSRSRVKSIEVKSGMPVNEVSDSSFQTMVRLTCGVAYVLSRMSSFSQAF